jgi:hypothetical protein
MKTYVTSSWLLRLIVSAGMLVASGCSSSSGPSPFNGSWTCTGSVTYTFTMPTVSPFTVAQPTSTLVFDIDDGSAITFTTASSANDVVGDGGVGCNLTYDTSGSSASLEPGQSCTVQVTEGATVYTFDITYGSGSASVSGASLTASQSDTFTGTAVKGGTSTNLKGTISGSRTCTN